MTPSRVSQSGRQSTGSSPRSSASSPHHRLSPRDYTSTEFWALVDRWKVPDPEALKLIGHQGGMTKKTTRPRFRVTGQEAEIFGYLKEIDASLAPLMDDSGAWMKTPRKEPPFKGSTPLDLVTRNGSDGAREVVRTILRVGLQQVGS
jgi:hypothetical protein